MKSNMKMFLLDMMKKKFSITYTLLSDLIPKLPLVGESGSGKSTLAKLLVHYYDLKEGAILIGNQNIAI